MLFARIHLDREAAALGMGERGLEALGQTLALVSLDLQPIDDDIHRMLLRLGELGQRIDVMHLAIHAQAHEALRLELGKQVDLLALAVRDDGCEDHQLGVLGQRQHMINHLRDAHRRKGDAMLGAVRRAGTRVEQAQVIVDLGDGADGRARIVAGRLLLDGNRRRQALDQVDIGLLHQLQELPRIG